MLYNTLQLKRTSYVYQRKYKRIQYFCEIAFNYVSNVSKSIYLINFKHNYTWSNTNIYRYMYNVYIILIQWKRYKTIFIDLWK